MLWLSLWCLNLHRKKEENAGFPAFKRAQKKERELKFATTSADTRNVIPTCAGMTKEEYVRQNRY